MVIKPKVIRPKKRNSKKRNLKDLSKNTNYKVHPEIRKKLKEMLNKAKKERKKKPVYRLN